MRVVKDGLPAPSEKLKIDGSRSTRAVRRHEVEQDSTPLDLVRTRMRNYLAATISRSSISNINVAPGLIRGGRPLSL